MSTTTLIVPQDLNGVRTGARKRKLIEDGLENLVEKYGGKGREASASLEFDRYGVRMPGLFPDWHNRLTAQDLAITMLMNSGMTPADVEMLLEQRGEIEVALRAVPVSVDLFSDWNDPLPKAVKDLFSSMEVHGVGLAKMTKVLCLKRPRLIPMLDSYVMKALYEGEWPQVEEDTYAEAGILAIQRFRELYRQNAAAVEALTEQINAWLSRYRHEPPVALTNVRVLETLLWGEWGGWTDDEKTEGDDD